MSRWREGLIHVFALFSGVGGPLFIFDRLKVDLGQKPAFAAVFWPVLLLVLGALAVRDDPAERLSRLAVRLGVVGAFFLTAANLYATWQLLAGAPHGNRGLIAVGIVVGLVAAAIYVREALPFLRQLERPPTA